MSRPGREISYGSVALALKARKAEPTPRALPFEKPEWEEPKASSEATQADLVPGESRRRRYAGALMLFAGLARLEVWRAFRALGVWVGPSRRWGCSETVAAVVLCFALRFHSIEDSNNGQSLVCGIDSADEARPDRGAEHAECLHLSQ